MESKVYPFSMYKRRLDYIFKIPGVLYIYSHCHFVSLTGSEPQKTNKRKVTADANTKDDASDSDSGSENDDDDDKGKDDESVLHLLASDWSIFRTCITQKRLVIET